MARVSEKWSRQMLVDSTTPPLDDTSTGHLPTIPMESSPKKPSRKSPRKQKIVGKISNVRKARASRRSSSLSIPFATRIDPAYETEVIPVCIPTQSANMQPQFQAQRHTSTRSILPTSFVLPPPSPGTSLPPPDTLLGAFTGTSSNGQAKMAESANGVASLTPLETPVDPIVSEPIPEDLQPGVASAIAPVETPFATKRPFPIAKPLASHMTHAYSPAKPSPLSRILMLAGSPDSPELRPFKNANIAPIDPADPISRYARDSEESPSREKAERNTDEIRIAGGKKNVKSKTRKPPVPSIAPAPHNIAKTSGSIEKENRSKTSRTVSPEAAQQTKLSATNTSKTGCLTKPGARTAQKFSIGRGGPRRVPVGSAEAAPGWKA